MIERTESEENILMRFEVEIKKLEVTNLAISKKTGFSAQTLTNILRKRNLPGVYLLSEINKNYPMFNVEYIITGNRRQNPLQGLIKDELEKFNRAILDIVNNQ